MISERRPAPRERSTSLAPPVRPEFEPSLPHLLRPWWRRLSPRRRRVLAVLIVLIAAGVALAIGVAASPRRYSHEGRVPFSFTYGSSLHRVKPGPGEYVKLERTSRGQVTESVAVRPLELPPYQGDPQAELPIYAAGYTRRLAATLPGFVSLGDGKIKVNNLPSYYVSYQLGTSAQPLYGRDFLVTPNRAGARSGVIIVMRATPAAGYNLGTFVGSGGDLFSLLANFHLG